jgi:hypothetical protein
MQYIHETRTRDVYREAVAIKTAETRTYFLPALTFAQRALCAAAILLRPAAEMVLFFRLDFPPRK